MKTIIVSLIIPYTADGKVLLQDRKEINKHKEDWGYFGGGIEEGEAREEALIREVMEELDVKLDFKMVDYIGSDSVGWMGNDNEEWQVKRYFFGTRYESIADKILQKEGGNRQLFTIKEAKELNMFTPENPVDPALGMIKQYLANQL